MTVSPRRLLSIVAVAAAVFYTCEC